MDKKVLTLFIISFIFLFLVSSVGATDIEDNNMTIASDGSANYEEITSDLSNDDIQSKFDNAKDGDSFEFTDGEYKDVSLVVNKKLNIYSKNDTVIYTSNELSDKAKDSGIEKTSGFYFTSKSAGSVLSGITIMASKSDCGVIVDNTNNVVVDDTKIVGGKKCILVQNSNKITVSNNDISKATENGVQLKDVKNSVVKNNQISYNKLSGIQTSNIYYCNITNNTIHHNGLNGISTFNKSSHNTIERNSIYENVNGVYINSTSSYDVVKTNSLTHNRKDPRSSMGGFETGNGFLLGSGFRSSGESELRVESNYLAHNEFYQAKNYWENDNFALGQNWYNSNDPSNTFVCPRLLASLMNMETLSVSNTLSLQLTDSSGKPVNEFATFQTNVEVDGNRYTATFKDGKATIIEDLDPIVDHDVKVEIGGQYYQYDYKASGDEGESKDSQSSSTTDDETGSQNPDNTGNNGTSNVYGNSNKQGNSKGGNSSGSHVTNSAKSGNYGTNSSNIPSQDTSYNGEDALSNGDLDAGDTGSGQQSQEGKAYEIVPPVTTSKELTNTSGLIVLCIASIMGLLIYGYRRGYDKDEF